MNFENDLTKYEKKNLGKSEVHGTYRELRIGYYFQLCSALATQQLASPQGEQLWAMDKGNKSGKGKVSYSPELLFSCFIRVDALEKQGWRI